MGSFRKRAGLRLTFSASFRSRDCDLVVMPSILTVISSRAEARIASAPAFIVASLSLARLFLGSDDSANSASIPFIKTCTNGDCVVNSARRTPKSRLTGARGVRSEARTKNVVSNTPDVRTYYNTDRSLAAFLVRVNEVGSS